MQLESAVHFCQEVLSGNLYNNQLVITDTKLIEKSDSKVGSADGILTEHLQAAKPSSKQPKVVLSSLQSQQTKPQRPPTLASVGTQVYASLLDNAASALDEGGHQSAFLGEFELQNAKKPCSDGRKLNLSISEERSDVSDVRVKSQLPRSADKPQRLSQRVRWKPVKLAEGYVSDVNNKKSITSKAVPVFQIATSPDIPQTTEDVANTNGSAMETADFGGLEELEKMSVNTSLRAENLVRKFNCSFCAFSTNNVRRISEHNREHQMANNICYYCEQRFDTSVELTAHVDAEHSDVKRNSMPFICRSCPARFRTRAQLVSHTVKHSPTRPFICVRCGASFKTSSALRCHAVIHTSRKEHLCDICGYATAHRGQLRSHRLVHTGGTISCSWPGCDYRTTRMHILKYHIVKHTHEKPHQCDVCGQRFSLSRNLKRHMVLHVKGATKYSCSRCVYSTLRYDKLKEHLHKQHHVGSAPERRVRITDLVNLDLAKTIKVASEPVLVHEPTLHQLDATDTYPVLPPNSVQL